MADAPLCVCGRLMRMVPVHHKRPRRTTHWAVCESCYPGQRADSVQAHREPTVPRLSIVKETA